LGAQSLDALELLASEIAIGISTLRLSAQHGIIDLYERRTTTHELPLMKQQRCYAALLVRAKLHRLDSFDSTGCANGIDDWTNARGIDVDWHRGHRHRTATRATRSRGTTRTRLGVTTSDRLRADDADYEYR
jgi:hypothetical protein